MSPSLVAIMFRSILFLAGLTATIGVNAENRCSSEIQKAANVGNIQGLSSLIDGGENIDCRGEWDQSLLIKAIQGGHPSAAEFLIEKGANSKIADDEGGLPIHRAAMMGQLNVFQMLADNTNINIRGRMGKTPLMWASNRGHLEVVKEAVARGANVNDQCDNGYTPLSYTMSADVAEFLLNVGANPNLRDKAGLTAIEYAQESIGRIGKFNPESEQVLKYKRKIEVIQNWSANE